MASTSPTSPTRQRTASSSSSSMIIQRSNSIEESSSVEEITRYYERTNTTATDESEANNSSDVLLSPSPSNNILLSPSNSKEEDFDSDNEDEVENININNMESSDNGLLEALAPGECSTPIHTTATTSSSSSSNKKGRFDLCGSMYKRRGGFGRNAENNWVMRSFTLYGHILCYHEESSPENIIDPSKPRARLNLAKTETIAEMHSKHKVGLPTDHLLTINIYDGIGRNKRKWEMCCTSKEQQLMWYNAIRAYDGLPTVVGGGITTSSTTTGRQSSSNGGGSGSGAWSPTHDLSLLPNIDSTNNLFTPSKSARIQGMTSLEEDVMTKAAIRAVEVWSEKQQEGGGGSNNIELSRNTTVLLFVSMNVAIYFVRNGSEQTYHATLFFINAFILYVVLERTKNNGAKNKGLKAKAAAKKKKGVIVETEDGGEGLRIRKTSSSSSSMEPMDTPHSRSFVKKMTGTTIPRSKPERNSELEMKLQSCGSTNSMEAIRAFASAPVESIQVEPHSYGQTNAPTFNLRVGPNYKKNKQKAPSGPALYDLYSMDFMYDSTPLKNVSDQFRIPVIPGITDVSTGHAHIPPMLVINTWLPGEEPSMFAKSSGDGDTYSIPMVFVLSKNTLEELKDIDTASPGVKLLSEWCKRAETEADFRGRFKCMGMIEDIESTSIPKFIHGYNGKPALVTKSGTFTRHENYIEFTINVNYWAFLARKGLHTLMPYFQDFIFNVGFTIEARHDEEMPEVLLGGCRIMNLDPDKAEIVDE